MNNLCISVGIVAYNEELYIPNLLDELLAQDYPKEFVELLLIDSMSTDSTKAIFEQFKTEYCNIYKNILTHAVLLIKNR